MATAKASTGTPRGTSPRRSSSGGEGEAHVSPARWAGVALIIASLMAAITLAVLSPSQPVRTGSEPEPQQPGIAAAAASPGADVEEPRAPTAVPRITSPGEGPTRDYRIPVTVAVPADELPRKDLSLAILRGDEVVATQERPKPDSSVTVPEVELLAGRANVLTAALVGPGNAMGPRSEPVVVTHDSEAPQLEIVSPSRGDTVYAKTVEVTLISEAGAEVRIRNSAADFESTVTLGQSGERSVTVPLVMGANPIVVKSTDQVGTPQTRRVRVRRLNGQPTFEVKVVPKRLKRSSLPRNLRVVVDVTDARGKPMPDATVAFTLGGDILSETGEGTTDAEGRSVWEVEVPRTSAPAEALALGITVTSPYGFEKSATRSIPLR